MPFLNLTPGTRNGIIQDERYAALVEALQPLETHLKGLIEEQQRAEEEQASQQSLNAIQKAFHEAMLALPREEYDWFDVQGRARQEGGSGTGAAGIPAGTDWQEELPGVPEPISHDSPQRQFFDFAGPLFGVVVSPAASTTPLNQTRTFRALPRDRSRRRVVQCRSQAAVSGDRARYSAQCEGQAPVRGSRGCGRCGRERHGAGLSAGIRGCTEGFCANGDRRDGGSGR